MQVNVDTMKVIQQWHLEPSQISKIEFFMKTVNGSRELFPQKGPP